jgi:phosphoribosylamine---glycine ligase
LSPSTKTLDILVVGSGGREHALIWKLARSKRAGKIYAAPGNPGIESLATLVPIKATEIGKLAEFAAQKKIGLTVVGPEQPLAEGLVNLFREKGVPVFGPTREAAELEWSKAFAKDFMARNGIPTAGYASFGPGDQAEAKRHVESCELPVVLKADGLAAGKGVIICETRSEARAALKLLTDPALFGSAGSTIVVEEFMTGEEASVFAVTDGNDAVILTSAQDHKRVNDGDEGKNTGGMGAYAPAPVVTPGVLDEVKKKILLPTLKGMKEEGRTYTGCLYVGLMITADGPKVVEYNCRFGDPETQVVLPLYGGDLLELFLASAGGTITKVPDPGKVTGSAACVVLASGGYPDAYEPGKPITGLKEASLLKDAVVFHAGTKKNADGAIVTAGGRVLGVTAFSQDSPLKPVVARAYEAVSKISFDEMHFRRDIGWRALKRDPQ